MAEDQIGTGYKFDAFISYSHRDAGDLAVAVEDGLEHLARPWNRRRALNVYLDRSSQAATADLPDSLRRTLDETKRMILLATPGGAASPWVAAEMEHWRAIRSPDDLIVAVAGGNIRWSEATGDFDWSTTTCLPGCLEGFFTSEPRWVDLRPLADSGERWDLHDAEFANAVAELSGGVTGRDKDDLIGEDLRQFRTAQRVRRIAVTALVLLTATAVTAAALATSRARQLAAERLAVASGAIAPDQPLTSILQALVSLRIRDTPEGHRALLAAVSSADHVPRAVGTTAGSPGRLTMSPDGDHLLVSTDDEISLHHLETKELEASQRFPPEQDPAMDSCWLVRDAGFTSAGAHVVAAVGDCVVLLDVPHFERLQWVRWLPEDSSSSVFAVAASPRNDLVAAGGGDTVSLYTFDQLELIDEIRTPVPDIVAIAFAADNVIMVGGRDGELAAVPIDGRPPEMIDSPHRFFIRTLQSASGGTGLVVSVDAAIAGVDREVAVWSLDDNGASIRVERLDVPSLPVGAVDAGFGLDSKALFAVADGGALLEWRLTSERLEFVDRYILPELYADSLYDSGMAMDPHERALVAEMAGVLYRWDTASGYTMVRRFAPGFDVSGIDVQSASVLAFDRSSVWVSAFDDPAGSSVVWQTSDASIRDAALAREGDVIAIATASTVHFVVRDLKHRWIERWSVEMEDPIAVTLVVDDHVAAVTGAGIFTLLDAGDGTPRIERRIGEGDDLLFGFSVDPSGRFVVAQSYCIGGGEHCGAVVDTITGDIEAYHTFRGTIVGDLRHILTVHRRGLDGPDRVYIVDPATGDERFISIDVPGSRVLGLEAADDGRRLLVYAQRGSRMDGRPREGIFRLFNPATGTPIGGELRLHGDLFRADLSSDGTLIAVADGDRVLVYDVDVLDRERATSNACELLGRNASEREWRELTGGMRYRLICIDS